MIVADIQKLKSYREQAEATMDYSIWSGESTGRIYGKFDAAEIKKRLPQGLSGPEQFVAGFRLCMENSPVEVREGELIVGDYYCLLPYEIIDMQRGFGRKGMQIMQSCGHTVGNISRGLELGWDGISSQIAASLREHAAAGHPDRVRYLGNLLKVVEIISEHIEKYAAEAQAGHDADPDGAYAAGYERTAAMCRKLAHKPPETLHEALQWHWFYITFERATSTGMGACKLDAVFLPYYRRDVANGTIEAGDAVTLLQACFLKEILFYSIGGMDENGGDLTNELSFAALKAYDSIGGPGNLNIRWHPGIDRDFFEYTLEVMNRHKSGTPGIVNDPVLIRSLIKFGFAPRVAASYSFCGCFWYVVPGLEYPYHDMESISGPRVLEAVMDEAVSLGTRDFESFMAIYDAKVAEGLAAGAEALAVIDSRAAEVYPEMVLSLLMDGCIEKGLDVTSGGAEVSMTTMLYVGLATVADSIYAIKKIVFDEGLFTIGEFAAILKSNFQGHEDLRLQCESLPKYGNDISDVDSLSERIATGFKTALSGMRNSKGFAFRPAFYSWHRHIFEGSNTGASADGRKAGQPVAQGVNPAHGRAVSGVTAAINSIAHIGFDDTAGAPMHLHFNAAGRENDTENLRSLIVSAFERGLPHIIVNYTDAAVLCEAMAAPEKHRDLVIRVTGYSARFVELSREIQEEVLKRSVF